MKILLRKDQQEAFKGLVEIIKVLAKVDGVEATDAIKDAFNLADILGVSQDIERLAGSYEDQDSDYREWTDMFCFMKAVRRIKE